MSVIDPNSHLRKLWIECFQIYSDAGDFNVADGYSCKGGYVFEDD